jgi:hypothetical protein
MTDSSKADPLRAVIALDRKVSRARAVLQGTSEVHPHFERRVTALVELVDRRDRVLNRDRVVKLTGRCPDLPPAA